MTLLDRLIAAAFRRNDLIEARRLVALRLIRDGYR